MDKKVLVVEDDSLLRDMLSQHLSKGEWSVLYAEDGQSALEIARADKPSIVLLDIMLPGMSGFEILAEMKKDPNLKDIPVVILSNLGQQEDIDKGLELGAVDFLIKSNFTLDEVTEKIKKLLA